MQNWLVQIRWKQNRISVNWSEAELKPSVPSQGSWIRYIFSSFKIVWYAIYNLDKVFEVLRVCGDIFLGHIVKGESKDIMLYEKAIGNRFEDKNLSIRMRRIAISLAGDFIISE